MKTKDKLIFIFTVAVMIVVSSFFKLGCLIRMFTGFSCPGCGISRAWIAVLHGDIGKAFHYHPLFLTAPFVAGAILFEDRLSKKALKIFWSVVLAAFIACYIIRIVTGSDVLEFSFRSGIIGRVLIFIWDGIRHIYFWIREI